MAMIVSGVRRLLWNRVNQHQCRCSFQIANRIFSERQVTKDDGSTTTVELGGLSRKYQVFKDEDSEIIMDVNEERLKYLELLENEVDQMLNPYEGLNLARGISGVYDIEDLVSILKKENGLNIFVAAVPKNINYVNYICLVNAKSYRHMLAMSQFVRKVYKLKMGRNDTVPKLEGQESRDWMALDMGNIALHVFSKEARAKYDLDSLWAVGSRYDDECNQEDPIAELLERHSIYLHDMKPAP
ncbi:PREDICTED: uncharacterized protein LOC108557742 [Nicrophorus vespilloides]|uniref:Uncharacterized protein LOC108557742 n=1 Tax=Nicrophorus vespilloides TaxID=110193 RepID=A0ABM1M5M7_NICVS|nr:PREDICTED: uncharacterized protein LOC108557742 [Nicrophorus vespilloides]